MDSDVKLLFDYRKYTLNKKFEVVRAGCRVSPYRILWQNDKLYLVGNFEGDSFSHYRVERICNLRLTKEPRKPISDIVGYGKPFDEAEYLSRAIELSRGVLTRVTIRFQNECLSEVFDSLGTKISVKDNGDGSFTLDDSVMLNKKLTRWVLSFGASAEVLRPKKLRGEVAAALQEAGKLY
jgi:predicted DNA-binding transcriptional regulator YafY